MADITFVTHSGLPGGSVDDQRVARRLEAAGVSVRFAVWDDPRTDWADSRVTVVRSAWDYHLHWTRWLSWIERVQSATRLINSATLLRWSSDKRYFKALAAAGIPVVPTRFIGEDAATLDEICRLEGWTDIVIKPSVGGGAYGARRFHAAQLRTSAQRHAGMLLRHGAVMVQPFQSAVETARERSLVFLDGRYSHAFVKPPFFSSADAGCEGLAAHRADETEIAAACAALGAAPERSTYARVDLVPSACGPLLMELELVEPDLGLRLVDNGAVAFADACLGLL